MQISKSNKIATITLLMIIILLLIFAGNKFYKKFLKVGTTKYNANIQKEDIKNINLSIQDKKDINQKLINNIQNPLRIILNFESLNIDYDTNLLNEEKNKFEIAWQNILKDTSYYDKIVWNKDDLDQDRQGKVYINYDEFKLYYEKILSSKLNDQKLLSGNIYNGIIIKNNNIYGSYVENFNNSEFILKTKSLELNEKSNIYTLNIDFLTSLNKDNTVNYDDLKNLYSPDILEYNNKYASLKIKYKIINNDYKLLSIVFKK